VVETENNAGRLLETVPKATDLVRIVAEIVLADMAVDLSRDKRSLGRVFASLMIK
jgi:hypothetical protein